MTTQVNCCLCGKSELVLKTLPSNYIDLTITSPPYDDLRDYEGFTFDFPLIAKELFRVTKEGGVLVWIVGDKVKNGSETLTSFKQAIEFHNIGFNLHDTMIYQKMGASLEDSTRYFQGFEYMFVLSKGKPKSINLLKDRRNKRIGETKKPYVREKNGEITRRIERSNGVNSKRFNIWPYPAGFNLSTKDVIAFEHPAIMPEDLVKDHILSWSKEGDLILDPFAGSGTTLKMAKLFNRNYLGIEISLKYCEIIKKRLDKYNNQKLEVFLA